MIITNRGREDVVQLGGEDYARLRRYEQRAFHVRELPGEIVDELGTVSPREAASQFDHEDDK